MLGFVMYHPDNRIIQIENAAVLSMCMNGDKSGREHVKIKMCDL